MQANTHVQALVHSNKCIIDDAYMKESAVEMPSAAEMQAQVVENPHKCRIPFSQDPPSRLVGWSPEKWESYQRFEEFERIIEKECKSEYAQQGAGSDNHGQFQSYHYSQQQAIAPPPPPPQCIHGLPPPPQCMYASKVQRHRNTSSNHGM